MPHEAESATPVATKPPPAELSNELLKMKIDDLFQEIDALKRRIDRLENASGSREPSGSIGAAIGAGVFSDPDIPNAS